MTDRVHASSHPRIELVNGWQIANAPPGSERAQSASFTWTPIERSATAAAALRALGQWNLESSERRFDAEDWWFRVSFDAPKAAPDSSHLLGFDGLATLATVWLNDELMLESSNMFLEHQVPVERLRETGNELLIRCASIDADLARKRPRPRWRTPMVDHQQLRWLRTTLLGRTPGWSPPAAPVGPWRPVWLETRNGAGVSDIRLTTALSPAGVGILAVSARLDRRVARAELALSGFGTTHTATLSLSQDGSHMARLEMAAVKPWWPHTHGDANLYRARVVLHSHDGDIIEQDLGPVGFRELTLDTSGGDFALAVNGVAVFCRGACWTPLDIVRLHADAGDVHTAVAAVRAAGMNMLRIAGNLVYESDDFFAACDAHGILVWQDFMFANMDYPADTAFVQSVERECRGVLGRIAHHPCLAILCGNSEAEQQAAMWGANRATWAQPLFTQTMSAWCAHEAPGVPYWPSSAHGGAFPHQSDVGSSSYYGVGAYRRPVEDARRSNLRFASECLAFANVPEEATLAAMTPGTLLQVHHPLWKRRVPRDLGAGWDFDDVRDHYFELLCGERPIDVRYAERDRFFEQSRIVSAEVMAAAFREWRRPGSSCRGALIWFLRDLWRGAGWGIVDAEGRPKAPYYLLRRLLQPRAVLFSDEGTNGLHLHAVNELAAPLAARLTLTLIRRGGARSAQHVRELTVPARGSVSLVATELCEGFEDLNHAYRFGAPVLEAVAAQLHDHGGALLAEDFHLPNGLRAPRVADLSLEAIASIIDDDTAQIQVRSRALARHVWIDVEGFEADDQYFHVAPLIDRRVLLRRRVPGAPLTGMIRAANAASGVRIESPP